MTKCLSQNPVPSNVRKYRKRRGWSQRELQRRSGRCIAMIEQGIRPNARLDTLQDIASALGVDMAALFETTERANKK